MFWSGGLLKAGVVALVSALQQQFAWADHVFRLEANMNGLSEESANASQAEENEDAATMSQREVTDFLAQIEELTPTIPDVVAAHYLNKAGVDTTDPRISRILALAAQKFLSDIINDALQISKLKGSQQTRAPKGKEKKYVLSLEDLAPTLAEYGIVVKKPAYYT